MYPLPNLYVFVKVHSKTPKPSKLKGVQQVERMTGTRMREQMVSSQCPLSTLLTHLLTAKASLEHT